MHWISDDGRIIRILGEGFYQEDEVRTHFARLDAIIEQRRSKGRRVIALVDLRSASPQSSRIAALIAAETDRLYTDPSDVVSIVVASMLVKLQFERVHRQQGFRVFLSHADGVDYVNAALGQSCPPDRLCLSAHDGDARRSA